MKIAPTYVVSFEHKMAELGTPAAVDYWMQPDDGERFQVKVTNHPKIIEHFEWLNNNDCFRYMLYPAPSYTTNVMEVEAIEHQNNFIQENAYALGQVSVAYDPITGLKRSQVPGLIPVPERVFTCTWTFFSREHAVMFKLARGGDL